MTTSDSIVRRSIRFVLSVSAIIFFGATASSASALHCSNAQAIGLNETVRGDLTSVEPDCFRLETPAAGLVMFDLAVPGTAAAEPRLGLQRCDDVVRSDVIDQSASHMLVSGDAAGELTFCIGAQDPSQALGAFKLQTAFVEGAPRKAEQVEHDPDPLAGCARKAEQVEHDPDPLAGCARKAEQVEHDPDPLAGSNALELLCQAQELDDHSDRLLCASPIILGRSVRGTIDNSYGDDRDFFVFELLAARTVTIEASGGVEALGGLYDRHGQQLAAAVSGVADAGFRMVKSLQSGLYFVRVEGAHRSQGDYSLAVSSVEHSW